MRIEGTFIKKLRERFEESFCLILLGAGIALLFFYINQAIFFEPTDMQNLILLMIGCFGSYAFLMDLFFDQKRKPLMQRHLLGVLVILLFLGGLSAFNTASKGIQMENMVNELPLIDSAVFLLFIFFLMIFLALLMVDAIVALVKKVKEYRSEIRNETTKVEAEEG